MEEFFAVKRLERRNCFCGIGNFARWNPKSNYAVKNDQKSQDGDPERNLGIKKDPFGRI